MTAPPADPALQWDVLKTEYERLKAEQIARIGIRDNLIYATLATLAAVVVAVYKTGNPAVWLALPLAVSALGWTYLANDRKISEIGRYLETVLAVAVEQLTGVRAFGWEQWHCQVKGRRLQKVGWKLVDLTVFTVPSATALAILWAQGPPLWAAILSLPEAVTVAALQLRIIKPARKGSPHE